MPEKQHLKNNLFLPLSRNASETLHVVNRQEQCGLGGERQEARNLASETHTKSVVLTALFKGQQ